MQASVTTPFARQQETDEPWILWEKKTSVTVLSDAEQTDCRSVSSKMSTNIDSHETILPLQSVPVIQRKQYNAVLSRMNQALGKSGSFSAWQT